jgi:predicted membrane-bound spermidine synthase
MKRTVLLSVFITGACVLVLEVAGLRVLTPYYGNTLFSFSSVLTVVLLGLSVGYWSGGVLADKHPRENLFFGLIALSGILVLLVALAMQSVLDLMALEFSLAAGPLILSTAFFLLPSIFLGMLSPFAIRLLSSGQGAKRIGSVSGKVFFWSTLGSILGSLGSGFYLIPSFGVQSVIGGIGIVLVMLGVAGCWRLRRRLAMMMAGLGVVLALLFFSGDEAVDGVVHKSEGIYGRIRIEERDRNGKMTRYFRHDRGTSGAMYVDSDELVFDYTQYFRLYPLYTDAVDRALVLGGGAYSVPKAMLADIPGAMVDVAEFEPSLYALAQEFFRLEESERLRNLVVDGRRALVDADEVYDVIYSDVYQTYLSVPFHFMTQEYYRLVRSKLNDEGIYVANVIGSLSRQKPSLMLSAMKTFTEVFPHSSFIALRGADSLDVQNIVFVGHKSERDVALDDVGFFDLGIQGTPEVIDVERFDLGAYEVLTDDYAPVEYMMMTIHKRVEEGSWRFDGKEALALIKQIVDYGPRHLTGEGHDKVRRFLVGELEVLGLQVIEQDFEVEMQDGQTVGLTNVIGRLWPENTRRILLSAHYDSRKYAGRGADLRLDEGVPGANDNASGVAVLLELARILSMDGGELDIGVDLVFMDGEEGEERLDMVDWAPIGSDYFSNNLSDLYTSALPELGIVLDMVCENGLNLHPEKNSVAAAGSAVEKLWRIGNALDASAFPLEEKWSIRADHTPLIAAGVPSMLVIDYDFEEYHSKDDDVAVCDADSLQVVGETVLKFLRWFDPGLRKREVDLVPLPPAVPDIPFRP